MAWRRGRSPRPAAGLLPGAWFLHLPSLSWLAFFFLAPVLIVMAVALRPADPYGGVGEGWTLENLRVLGQPIYLAIAWRTLWLSAATTAICLLLGIPAGYCLARSPPRRRPVLVLLVVIPFWTNCLIRVFAWKVLLHPEGLLKQALVDLHLAGPETSLLYRPEAVLLVLVYTYLPFAILPIYAAAERFDFALFEAALDLGCRRLRAFVGVFLPGIRRGLVTAALVVFIPALGSYVIPDLVGGPAAEMVGNKITQRMLVDRNLPAASALSAALTLAVVLPMLWTLYLRREEEPGAPMMPEQP